MKEPRSVRSGTAQLVVVVGLLLIVALLALYNNLRIQRDVIVWYAARSDFQRVFSSILDEETGVRGYIATRQALFLAPYTSATHLTGGYLTRLQSEVDPSLQPDMEQITKLHERWLREFAAPLIGLPSRTDSLKISLRGKTLMDDMRGVSGDFLSKVNRHVASEAWQGTLSLMVARLALLLSVVVFAVFGIRLERARLREERRLRERLARRNRELERSNQALQEFAYIASHDLQEPLRSVASFTQLLSRRYAGKLDDQADEYIAFAVDGAHRMQALIDNILEYSRVTTHGAELIPTDLNPVVAASLSDLRTAIAERHAEVTVGPLPIVMGDARQLEQLFQNLIGNAIKYNRSEPPAVWLQASRTGPNEWTLSVRDNGIGISPQYHERIFRIFQRLHTRVEYSGTGIGLSICKRIVDRHEGRMWVDSDAGKGATFYLTLQPGRPGATDD